jgi:hypothetical protein
MSSESVRTSLRALALAALLVALPQAACFNVISGDQELVDELTAFKVRGSVCPTVLAPPAGDGGVASPLAGATTYRWLAYGGLLGESVSPSGNVRYPLLNGDGELLAFARATVEHVAQVHPSDLESRDDRLAFWINAYNALVLDGAARAFAVDPTFRVDENGFAFFDNEVHVVGGMLMSLNQIESGVLRGDENHPAVYPLEEERKQLLLELSDSLWGGGAPDPRFHFVINCASSSCPSLLAAPLRGDTVDQVLEDATDAFLHDDSRGAGPAGISEIFAFYFNDFEPAGGIDAFIAQYRSLDEVNTGVLLPYDWSLNVAAD